jgi:outer membrane protein TolC
MIRRPPLLGIVLAVVVAMFNGCQPQQPFYLHEDGDLSHYKAVATEIEYPDLQAPPNAEVEGAGRPYSLNNKECKETWDLALEEAVQIALVNNKVIRNIGGQVQGPPEFILRNAQGTPTIYDPALVESDPRSGVEGALAAFDAQFHSLAQWQRVHMPINTQSFPPIFLQTENNYTATFQNRLQKTTATGATVALSHDFINTSSTTSPLRLYPMDWTTELRAEIRQPLLQGAGVQFNRIAGPGAVQGQPNGVMLARIRTDVALADFEIAVRNLLSDVEGTYWELYFSYRALDTAVASRDSALQTWRQVNAKFRAGKSPAHEEAQSRQQYWTFVTTVQQALTGLYQTESKMRYMLGLTTTDGRLIRPKDEPTTAKVTFDWCECIAESVARNVELRQHRWLVKQRELQLIAAKNYLLPRLDLLASYQWQGLGNLLLDQGANATGDFTQVGSNAYQNMLSGEFATWMVGAELTVPIGFRREMAGVRNAQLDLARQRARYEEAELELSHQLAFAVRDLDSNHEQAQSNFNRRIAARDEVKAALAKYNVGVGTLTDVLDAQRRLADAEQAYYRNIVDYAKDIIQVHYRKGSLLEYNGVCLAEGPWPAKAYFDACRRARARDAAWYIDYGFTMPKVISRGPYDQRAESNELIPGGPAEATEPTPAVPELIPTPTPTPAKPKTGASEATIDMSSAIESATPEQRQVAGQWLSTKQSASGENAKPYGLGATKVEPLAQKTPGWSVPDSERGLATRQASYEEPAPVERITNPKPATSVKAAGNPNGSNTKPSDTTAARIKWLEPSIATDRHETATSSSSAESDQPTSGWKRMER